MNIRTRIKSSIHRLCWSSINSLQRFYWNIMSRIALPTVDDKGDFIDPNRVLYPYIFVKNGKKFIHCFVDGVLYFLIWTPELERWFQASGFSLPEFDHVPNNGIESDVINVPVKYKKTPQP